MKNNFMYSYKDIVLQPDYSEIISRKNANCKPIFLGKEFNVPGDDYLEYLYGTTWKTPIKK